MRIRNSIVESLELQAQTLTQKVVYENVELEYLRKRKEEKIRQADQAIADQLAKVSRVTEELAQVQLAVDILNANLPETPEVATEEIGF